ncbi:MAG: type VI secretion system baseplate subunit TssF [Bryobacteraceae bacterium]|nr:type VI secretion system baseplate subunit TssF [Bryobacteraceae bacterium]
MRDELLLYYERELTFLRQMGAQFAEKYPKIASRLNLEPDKCEDPHIERLLESFAFLAARVHLKIDDEFPEVTEALLSIVYPHFIRPVPSMTVVEFQVRPEQAQIGAGLKIERGATLSSRPVNGVPCKFRTCYETMLWPLGVSEAEWKTPDRLPSPVKAADAVAALRVELSCWPGVSFDKLNLSALRFFLNGESGTVHTLYELLCSRCTQILLRDPTPGSRVRPLALRPDALRPVGFDEDDAMLPYPRRSFAGYRLLHEYFTFPDKFFFLDLTGLDALAPAGFKDRVEIVFLIAPFERTERRQALELGVSAKTLKLACTPAVNLFPQTAEPILVTQRKFEYPIIPDIRRPNALEVHSVDEVVSVRAGTQDLVRFEPFYSFRHAAVRSGGQTFWLTSRRPSARRDDDGSELFLSLVDLAQRPVEPDVDSLTVRLTCTNRDLPARLPFGNVAGDFELEGGAPVHAIVALRKPTPALRPPVGKGAFWRLISHLSLNYLSLVDEGREALQEILKLYNFTDSTSSLKQIEGIVAVTSRKQFARVNSENGITFARGTRVDLELDEENFVGGGAYLFASVLEHFLGLYVTLNSFSQLSATTRQRKEALQLWPPRAGRRVLL